MEKLGVALCALATLVAFTYANPQDRTDAVKDELRAFVAELNGALARRDRAALERLYADEFRFVHATTGVVARAEHIEGIMANDATVAGQLPEPSFDEMSVYGDVVILRGRNRGIENTSIYRKQDGRWQAVQVQGTLLPPVRTAVTVDSKTLDRFVGAYEFRPGAQAVVVRQGEGITWKAGTRPTLVLQPLAGNRFFGKGSDAEITFTVDAKGQVDGAVLKLGTCTEQTAKKVK